MICSLFFSFGNPGDDVAFSDDLDWGLHALGVDLDRSPFFFGRLFEGRYTTIKHFFHRLGLLGDDITLSLEVLMDLVRGEAVGVVQAQGGVLGVFLFEPGKDVEGDAHGFPQGLADRGVFFVSTHGGRVLNFLEGFEVHVHNHVDVADAPGLRTGDATDRLGDGLVGRFGIEKHDLVRGLGIHALTHGIAAREEGHSIVGA